MPKVRKADEDDRELEARMRMVAVQEMQDQNPKKNNQKGGDIWQTIARPSILKTDSLF